MRHTPLYKRGKFWGLVSLAAVVVFIAAGTILSKQFPVADFQAGPKGDIAVTTEPQGATIYVDGKEYKDKSNTKITRATGKHAIKLRLNGYDDQEVTADVKEGQTFNITHQFTKQGVAPKTVPAPGQSATRTYTSKKFGYSVTYPGDWRVETDGSGVAHFFSAFFAKDRGGPGESDSNPGSSEYESLSILVMDNSKNLSPEAWYKARDEYAMEDQSQITQKAVNINGRPGYQWETPYGFVPFLNTVFTGSGKAFVFQQKQGSPDRPTYDEIVASFTL